MSLLDCGCLTLSAMASAAVFGEPGFIFQMMSTEYSIQNYGIKNILVAVTGKMVAIC